MIKHRIQLVFAQIERIRRLLATFLLLAFLAPVHGADVTAPDARAAAAPADAAETSPQVLVNHVGFTPRAAKYCMLAGSQPVAFEIIDTTSSQPVFAGHTTPGGPDLGPWQVGDFSSLTKSASGIIISTREPTWSMSKCNGCERRSTAPRR